MTRKRNAHIFPKAKDGWYCEPLWCSARLFEEETFARTIYDPACGGGNILRSAEAAGFVAVAGDVVKRRGIKSIKWGFVREDFLQTKLDHLDTAIVCNPPFDHVEAFCRKACDHASAVAMMMLTRRLNAAHWLHELPLHTIYLLTPRPSMPPGEWIAAGNKPGGGTQDFCWLIFRRGYKGTPQLQWLHRDRGAPSGTMSSTCTGPLSKPSRGVSRSRRISSNVIATKSTTRKSYLTVCASA